MLDGADSQIKKRLEGIPVQRCLLGRIQMQKSRVCNGHDKLHLDILDVQQRLRTEEILPAERELIDALCALRAFPSAVRIVHGQQIRVACNSQFRRSKVSNVGSHLSGTRVSRGLFGCSSPLCSRKEIWRKEWRRY